LITASRKIFFQWLWCLPMKVPHRPRQLSVAPPGRYAGGTSVLGAGVREILSAREDTTPETFSAVGISSL
jgi:hypothetical protein